MKKLRKSASITAYSSRGELFGSCSWETLGITQNTPGLSSVRITTVYIKTITSRVSDSSIDNVLSDVIDLAVIVDDVYIYLVSNGTPNGTYTSGRNEITATLTANRNITINKLFKPVEQAIIVRGRLHAGTPTAYTSIQLEIEYTSI